MATRSIKKVLAPMLLAAALMGLGLAGWREIHRGVAGSGLRALAIGFLVLWLLLEVPLAARVASDDQRGEDRGTLRWNALSRVAALLAALGGARMNLPMVVPVVGLVLFVAGFSFRVAAIRTLGRFYSHKVRRADDHQVVGTGPYRLVRHPAYLGVIVAHLGFALVFASPLAVLAVVLLVVPAFVHRIRVEEPMLMKIPGWGDYARGRARLVPKIW